MSKEIIFQQKAEKLFNGIMKMAEPVKVTWDLRSECNY